MANFFDRFLGKKPREDLIPDYETFRLDPTGYLKKTLLRSGERACDGLVQSHARYLSK